MADQRNGLRLYLDSADEKQWQRWLPAGLFYGVTCNPLLLEKAGVACQIAPLKRLSRRALDLDAREVHLQAWGDSAEALFQTGERLAALDERIVVKLPVTQAGTTAAAALVRQGIPVTLTAVYAVHQVLIAAAIGAQYAAPYLGRINDGGGQGRESVAQMQRALDGVGANTRVLTASIRTVEDISVLAAQGVDTFTISSAIAQALFEVPETLAATADFEQVAQKSEM